LFLSVYFITFFVKNIDHDPDDHIQKSKSSEKDKADINGDGLIDLQDASIIKAAFLRLFAQLDVSAEEEALSDINGDGRIDVFDIKLLEHANKFYANADLNGDGIVSRVDIEIMEGMFDSLYSEPILTISSTERGGSNRIARGMLPLAKSVGAIASLYPTNM